MQTMILFGDCFCFFFHDTVSELQKIGMNVSSLKSFTPYCTKGAGKSSNAVKRLGQFYVLFRDISFTVKWKHEQGYI